MKKILLALAFIGLWVGVVQLFYVGNKASGPSTDLAICQSANNSIQAQQECSKTNLCLGADTSAQEQQGYCQGSVQNTDNFKKFRGFPLRASAANDNAVPGASPLLIVNILIFGAGLPALGYAVLKLKPPVKKHSSKHKKSSVSESEPK